MLNEIMPTEQKPIKRWTVICLYNIHINHRCEQAPTKTSTPRRTPKASTLTNMLLSLFLFSLSLGAVSPLNVTFQKTPSDVSPVKLQRGTCPMFWYSFRGRCYKYVATHMTWADAELHCLSQGANLVSIYSGGEQTFVNDLIKNFDPLQQYTWIGLSDIHKEGKWMWSDGCPVNFVFWDLNEPNNYKGIENCAHTNFITTLKWNDMSCINTYSFVCATRVACSKWLMILHNSPCEIWRKFL